MYNFEVLYLSIYMGSLPVHVGVMDFYMEEMFYACSSLKYYYNNIINIFIFVKHLNLSRFCLL